jgi:hypothetical protein
MNARKQVSKFYIDTMLALGHCVFVPPVFYRFGMYGFDSSKEEYSVADCCTATCFTLPCTLPAATFALPSSILLTLGSALAYPIAAAIDYSSSCLDDSEATIDSADASESAAQENNKKPNQAGFFRPKPRSNSLYSENIVTEMTPLINDLANTNSFTLGKH